MDSFKDVSPLHDPFTALKAGASKRRGQETSFAMRSLLFSTYRFSMSSEHAGISAQDACDFLQDGPTFLYANPSVLSVEADPVEAGLFQVTEKLDNPVMRATAFTSRIQVSEQGSKTVWTSEAALGVRVRSVYKVSSVGGSKEHQKEKETVKDENTGSGKGVVIIDEETDVRAPLGFMWYVRWQIDIAHKKFHKQLVEALRTKHPASASVPAPGPAPASASHPAPTAS
ncbi:hypothetical protein FA10DRAFT_263811 [Acaromyces ingoldii]|uniref:DUF7053 domain-containing protein n=1 Tax=Acaromyces ingoldii TaxID=215250 RepID=A0A316YU60_9BASI|nr:hypothetical protein FA10DRAFT_263811 [Acaromyces ingoldii]PWN93110.1 hypothetical protein FA10DRAFT_263811 [Acaromyces ingoldii]